PAGFCLRAGIARHCLGLHFHSSDTENSVVAWYGTLVWAIASCAMVNSSPGVGVRGKRGARDMGRHSILDYLVCPHVGFSGCVFIATRGEGRAVTVSAPPTETATSTTSGVGENERSGRRG